VNAPGIYTPNHIEEWKVITDAVHAKGGIIYCQLWAIGRANGGDELGVEVVSSSNLALEGGAKSRPLTVEEIQSYTNDFAQAAKNAIQAGFDGVEVLEMQLILGTRSTWLSARSVPTKFMQQKNGSIWWFFRE
jgi:NADPH2 dehydrogenase